MCFAERSGFGLNALLGALRRTCVRGPRWQLVFASQMPKVGRHDETEECTRGECSSRHETDGHALTCPENGPHEQTPKQTKERTHCECAWNEWSKQRRRHLNAKPPKQAPKRRRGCVLRDAEHRHVPIHFFQLLVMFHKLHQLLAMCPKRLTPKLSRIAARSRAHGKLFLPCGWCSDAISA